MAILTFYIGESRCKKKKKKWIAEIMLKSNSMLVRKKEWRKGKSWVTKHKSKQKKSYEREKERERVKQGFNVTPVCMINQIISSLDFSCFYLVSVCLNICVVVVGYLKPNWKYQIQERRVQRKGWLRLYGFAGDYTLLLCCYPYTNINKNT